MALLLGKHLAKHNVFAEITKISAINKNSVRFKFDVKKNMTQNEKDWTKINSEKLLEKAKSEKGISLQINPEMPQLFYNSSKELESASEIVKKLVSLEFASRDDFKRYEDELIIKEFRRNVLDDSSLEIQIALHTINIKRMCHNQNEFKNKINFKGKNKRVRFFLYRQIHRRDRLMLELFHVDNKRYEWLKEKLEMHDYELQGEHPYRRETKYDKFVNEVHAKADQERKEKLSRLRAHFDDEKKRFFKEKEQILLEITSELKELDFENQKGL